MSESKSGLYETRDSIYCYKGSNVLINKLNIHDNKILKQAEEKIVAAKLFILRQNTMIKNFDVNHFKGIHKFLFEDIYPFAGKFRTENIAKGFFSFAEWEFIEDELSNLLKKLNESNNLKNLKRDEFVKAIAYYLSELNVLHPFREGNGRSTRIWLDLIFKKELNLVVDWSKVDKTDYLLAMERSPIKDIEIKELLKQSLTDKVNDREVYMKGIDNSYLYEGYLAFKTDEL